jgi:hypothetical protein
MYWVFIQILSQFVKPPKWYPSSWVQHVSPSAITIISTINLLAVFYLFQGGALDVSDGFKFFRHLESLFEGDGFGGEFGVDPFVRSRPDQDEGRVSAVVLYLWYPLRRKKKRNPINLNLTKKTKLSQIGTLNRQNRSTQGTHAYPSVIHKNPPRQDQVGTSRDSHQEVSTSWDTRVCV